MQNFSKWHLIATVFLVGLPSGLAQQFSPRVERICFFVWHPGNFNIFQLLKFYSGPPPAPDCPPVPGGFCNDVFNLFGEESYDGTRWFRLISEASPPNFYAFGTNILSTNIDVSATIRLGFVNGAGCGDVRFTNFDVELGTVVENGGWWSMLSDHDILPHGALLGTFHNTGWFQKTGGNGVTRIRIPFSDAGGTVDAQTGVIEFDYPDVGFNGTHFTGAGTIRFSNGARFGNMSSNSTNLELTGGIFTGILRGQSRWTGGEVGTSSAPFVNEGTLVVPSARSIRVGAGGVFQNDTIGIMELEAGETVIAGENGAMFQNFGLLRGTGRLVFTNGNFVNYGTIKPGSIWIEGDCSQQGEVQIEIAGLSTNQFGRLFVTGNLSRSGLLRVTLADGYMPDAGDSFSIIQASTSSGDFSTVDLPSLSPPRFWRTDRLSSEGVLSVGLVPSNRSAWQNAYFTEAELLDPSLTGWGRDPDGDGIINFIEYVFGLVPRSVEQASTMSILPSPVILQKDSEQRFAIRFSIPEPSVGDAIYEVQVTYDLEGDNWETIASKKGVESWSGDSAAAVSPGTAGRVEVTVEDVEPFQPDTQRFLRLILSPLP